MDTIDYQELVDNAMRRVVWQALKFAERAPLPGDHHFYISFKTDYPGVSISEALRARFPEEITIVLQHQFWDLKVEDVRFMVTLSFSNVPEKLVVPFEAVTAFADPSVKFGLQFHVQEAEAANDSDGETDMADALVTPVEMGEKVVTLDAFRKK